MEAASKDKNITTTFDPMDLRKWKHKWQSAKEFETVKSIRDRAQEMIDGRRTSCYWAATGGETEKRKSLEKVTGSNWDDRWDQDYKLWSMYHEYIEGRSNLKSPISFAPVEAALAEFQDKAYGVTLLNSDDEDDEAVMIFNHAIEAWEDNNNLDEVKSTSLQETMITGSGWTYNCYLHREREVEYILSSYEAEKYIKEARQKSESGESSEHEEIKKKLTEDKKAVTKKGIKVDYDDCAAIPVSIREIYPDPAARCVRGTSHEMVDILWRTVVSVDQFYAEFKNCKDTFVIQDNITKVKPAMEASDSYGAGVRFFNLPNDLLLSKNQIELLRYYNKQTDKYIIIANDVLVRDGPLPYNHKELPFSLHKFINFPHQLYGVGMPTMLESLQAEDETTRNMAIELLKRQLSSVVLVNSDIAEDFMSQWDTLESNLVIEMSGSVGNDAVRVLEGPVGRAGDIQQMRNSLREDSVMTSGVNPLQYSQPKPGEPVRNNQMSQESTLKMLRKGFINWGRGYRETIRQIVSIMSQMYPDSYTEQKSTEERKVIKKYKKIKVKGYEILKDPISGKLQKQRLPDGKHESSLELRPDFLSLTGPIKVRFNIEAYLPPSKALERQNIEAAANFLIPILSNPQLLTAPGVTEIVKQYCELNDVDQQVIELLNDSSSEDDIMLAEEQNNEMMAGKAVTGVPGSSDAHKITHASTAMEIQTLLSDPTITPEEYQKQSRVLQLLSQHMMTDNMPLVDVSAAVAQMPVPPPPQDPNMMGAMQGGMPMDPSMMQGQPLMGQPMPQGMPGGQMPVDPSMMGMPQGF